ncbi:hypothetical protein PHLCEN_2v4168 [Hermanssonia centrifuga]|uniref:GRIP domain-containing protein n=1 Tax=Hermanssonia centrifuga TaxID=98765 RepID=A0A2R6PZ19_9APHY|nr:hypothetical protein PHLCEN_2v4168 [Hermanssonia centrifuga]
MSEPPESNGSRQSFDSERVSSPSPTKGLNGTVNGRNEDLSNMDPVERLQHELERTKEEKDTLAAQYRNLLSKLTTMRTTLGNKLKQDAEELDRQEQLVQQLTIQNEDLATTVETMKSELIASNEEAERASRELETMRSRAFQENAQEAYLRERELREAQAELEQCRIERDEWEHKALQELVVADEAKGALEEARRDLRIEIEARDQEAAALGVEREKVDNLQSVLEDFQAETQLQLEESATNSTRTQELEKEVKEKNLLIGKLRHEAVIMNEHLMEALRRLRRSSTDTNVDRRLVTNVLLSFLTTPRADSKRFEMLTLLSSILQWNDDEREKAGLQRKNGALPSTGSLIWGRSSNAGKGKSPELEKTDETESFSRLWVEFLLTEAASGENISSMSPKSPSRPNNSLPPTPTRASHSPIYLSPGSQKGGKRLPSFSSPFASAAMSSSPNLVLNSPPQGKGKEKALDDS